MVSVGLQYRPNVVSKELAGDFLIVMSKKSIEFWDASQMNLMVSCLVFK